jgi:hypothetical protein
MAAILNWLPLLLRRRKREQSLAQAASWPIASAKLLKSTMVEKDPLAEGGTAFQDRQVESAFYFTLPNRESGAYFGGHLRSVPMSDSEAHRALRTVPEDTPLLVRYNPQNPDQTVTLAADNEDFPYKVWPT